MIILLYCAVEAYSSKSGKCRHNRELDLIKRMAGCHCAGSSE